LPTFIPIPLFSIPYISNSNDIGICINVDNFYSENNLNNNLLSLIAHAKYGLDNKNMVGVLNK